MTWTCHICHRERPDEKIGVHTHQRSLRGVPFTENVRYCNDNPDCVEKARDYHFVTLGKEGA